MVETKQREELDELLCVTRTYLDNSSDRGLTIDRLKKECDNI